MDASLFSLYTRAYALLGNLTPIPADCGELCSAKCCSGDNDAGMILFPGEKEFLSRADFLNVQRREMNGTHVDFATCPGKCRRQLRPLSCRIFPLAPFWDGEVLRVQADPRAQYLCPLLQAEDFITPEFRKGVEEAFSVLLEHPEISDMLMSYTRMLEQYMSFTGNK